MTVVEVKKKAEILQKEYKSDLGISFPNEIVHFRSHLKSLLKNNKYVPKTIQQMLVLLKENNFVDIYPYTDVVLRIILCTHVSNCSTERSFSTLKRIKSYLRSTIKEERLNALAIMNIESEITMRINYDTINQFAEQQSRKKL